MGGEPNANHTFAVEDLPTLFEQLVMPMLRQRNPQARRQAADTVSNLSRLGGELRAALIERALRDIR